MCSRTGGAAQGPRAPAQRLAASCEAPRPLRTCGVGMEPAGVSPVPVQMSWAGASPVPANQDLRVLAPLPRFSAAVAPSSAQHAPRCDRRRGSQDRRLSRRAHNQVELGRLAAAVGYRSGRQLRVCKGANLGDRREPRERLQHTGCTACCTVLCTVLCRGKAYRMCCAAKRTHRCAGAANISHAYRHTGGGAAAERRRRAMHRKEKRTRRAQPSGASCGGCAFAFGCALRKGTACATDSATH